MTPLRSKRRLLYIVEVFVAFMLWKLACCLDMRRSAHFFSSTLAAIFRTPPRTHRQILMKRIQNLQ